MEMVEKVARAIWAERVRDAANNGIDLGAFDVWAEANNISGEARAAIEAMREPGEDFASYLQLAHDLRPQDWSELIDALTEPSPSRL